jgi:hypothetical protein
MVSIQDLANSSHLCKISLHVGISSGVCTPVAPPSTCNGTLMAVGNCRCTLRVAAATLHTCRPPPLSLTSGRAVLSRQGQNGVHQTQRNVYKNNYVFWRNSKPREGRTKYERGLDIFITNSRVANAACLSSVSQAFSDMLSEGFAPVRSHVHAVWTSVNRQILNLAVGCESFSTFSQLTDWNFAYLKLHTNFTN